MTQLFWEKKTANAIISVSGHKEYYMLKEGDILKEGDVVMHYLTGEYMMILEVLTGEKIPGFTVRRSSDYGVMNVGEFEIGPPQETTQPLNEVKDEPENN